MSDLPAGFSVCAPVLLQSNLEFPFSLAQTELRHQAGQGRVSPCGAGRVLTHTHIIPYDKIILKGPKHRQLKEEIMKEY